MITKAERLIRMEEKQELVSIIMAAYNAEKTIDIAINSVLAQTYTEWELLVINDYSKDHTAEIVASFTDPRIRLLQNEKNSGVSISRKKGMEAANGEWIAVLDSDDAWTPDKLEKQVKLANDTGAELIFTGSAFMDDDGKPIDWQLHVPTTLPYRELLKQNLVSNSSVVVIRRSWLKCRPVGKGNENDFAPKAEKGSRAFRVV